MAHHRPPSSSSSSSSSSCVFGDTAFTKVFVGGLAWETQCDTMRRYFQQFGDILEAVVIVDKHTGRSKGYGFVTFRDPEAARRACLDPSPIIDGRRANCNLASLGAQRSRPSTPLHGGRFRPVSPHAGAPQPALPTPPFSQPMPFAFQQGLPYPPFVYPPYPPEYYPPNLYNPFAGAQFPVMYGAPGPLGSPTMYPPPSIQLPPIQPGFGMPHAQLLPYGSQALGGFTVSNMHPGPSPGHMSPGAGPGPPPPPFVLPASSPQPFNSGGPPNSRQVE